MAGKSALDICYLSSSKAMRFLIDYVTVFPLEAGAYLNPSPHGISTAMIRLSDTARNCFVWLQI